MDSSTPFFRQLSRPLIIIFINVFLLTLLALLLIDHRDEQVNYFLNKQALQFEEAQLKQQILIANDQLLKLITRSSDSALLVKHHNQYLTNLETLKVNKGISVRAINRLIKSEIAHKETLGRLVRQLITALILVPYMLKSKRVKATFVEKMPNNEGENSKEKQD